MTSHARNITRACSCAPLSLDRSVTHFGCSCSVALRVITGSRCTFMIRRTLNIARKARPPQHLALRRWRMKSPGGMMDVRVRHVVVRPTLPRLNDRVGSHRRDSLFDISACYPWAWMRSLPSACDLRNHRAFILAFFSRQGGGNTERCERCSLLTVSCLVTAPFFAAFARRLL